MNAIVLFAAIYGTIVSNDFVKAPYAVKVGDVTKIVEKMPEVDANAVGYKMMLDEPPVCDTNHYAVATGWREDARIHRVYEVRENPPPPPRKFSKLKIYGTISMLPEANGTTAWAKIEAWLRGKEVNGVNGWMAFQLAQEISEDHVLFAAWADEARQVLGLTQEQFDQLINACVLED